jgi:hypothetical protein
MSPHDQIVELLKVSILRVARLRLLEGFYKDDEESRKPFYFPTLEGLESILIPAIAIEEVSWPTLVSNSSEIQHIVSKDIEYILSLNNANKKKKQGAPYFFTGRGASKKFYWISECGAFTLSTLINTLTLAQRFPEVAPTFNNIKLRASIKQNVIDLLDCAVTQGGWSWSKGGKTADAWATWSVVETFTDYLAYVEQFGIKFPEIRKIKANLNATTDYLESQLDWHSPTTVSGSWYQRVYESRRIKTPNQVKCAYSFVHTMISSSLLKLQEREQFRELAALLFKSVENVKVKNVENLAHVASQDDSIDDYSYHPTLLRALTAIYVEMNEEGRQDLKNRLDDSPVHYIKKQFERLMRDYILKDEWAGLWGYGKSYEIYYTERTIEALVSLTEFLTSWDKDSGSWSIPKAKIKPTKHDLQIEIEKARHALAKQLK